MKVKTKFMFAIFSVIFLLFSSNATEAQGLDYSEDVETSINSVDDYSEGVSPASVEQDEDEDFKSEEAVDDTEVSSSEEGEDIE